MTSPTYVFMDTEWADEAGEQLVSLALVSEDGQHVFYAERDPLPGQPTEFVRTTVYPKLDRGTAAHPDLALTAELRRFLAGVPEPHVLADYSNDLRLLERTLNGFDVRMKGGEAVTKPSAMHMLKDERMAILIEEWFAANPDEAARRHHALVDARALRMAWLAATGRRTGSWVPSS